MIKILQLKHKIYKYKPSISVAYRGVAAGGTILLQRVGFWQIFSWLDFAIFLWYSLVYPSRPDFLFLTKVHFSSYTAFNSFIFAEKSLNAAIKTVLGLPAVFCICLDAKDLVELGRRAYCGAACQPFSL